MSHVSARAPRWPKAVSPGATRSIAPPSQPVMTCDCGRRARSKPASSVSMNSSLDLGQVVHACRRAPAVRRRLRRASTAARRRASGRRGRRRRARPRAAARARARPRRGRRTTPRRRPPRGGPAARRERRLRRRGDQHDEGRQRVRRGLHQRARRLERLARALPREHEQPAEHDRPDAVGLELEPRDDAEVAAAAAQRPEQVGVLVALRARLAVGEHDLGPDQRVDRQPVVAHQPADPAAEREPADAGVRDLAAGHGQPVLLRRGVELARAARRRRPARRARAGSTDDAFSAAQVDAQRAVADRAPGRRSGRRRGS